jgi:hypothetical protein
LMVKFSEGAFLCSLEHRDQIGAYSRWFS